MLALSPFNYPEFDKTEHLCYSVTVQGDMFCQFRSTMRNKIALLLVLILTILASSCQLSGSDTLGAIDKRKTRTPTPAVTLSPTSTPTPLPPTSTLTPTSTPTPLPTFTSTLAPTKTVTPAITMIPPTATPTSPPGGICPPHENKWHAPADVPCWRHHHGIDPRSTQVKQIFNIDGFNIETLMLNPFGELWQPLWLSSPNEEREGFIWALYSNHDCIQGGPNSTFDFSGHNCIVDVLVRHHDTGMLDHWLKFIHSEAMIIKACKKLSSGLPDFGSCGILLIPGRNPHYGMAMAAYKKVFCHLPGEPTNANGDSPALLQANYRTSRTQFSGDEFNVQYWVSVTTDGVLDQYYEHNFNATVTNFAWGAEGWQFWPAVPGAPKTPDVSFCGVNESFAEIQDILKHQPIVPGVEHRIFQLIDLRVSLPLSWGSESTFWMDVFGNPQPPGVCTQPSGQCVPWWKSPNFPGPKVALNFDAINLGLCNLVPCFVAETNGVPMLPPHEDVP